jgi:hypothetical protein
MRLRTYLGFREIDRLEEMLRNIYPQEEIDTIRKYVSEWQTARFSKEDKLEVRDIDDLFLLSFRKSSITFRDAYPGRDILRLYCGDEYIFGVNPIKPKKTKDKYRGKFFYMNLDPQDEDYKTEQNTGIQVYRNSPKIHFYLRYKDKELEIARLSPPKINVIVHDGYGSNVWL